MLRVQVEKDKARLVHNASAVLSAVVCLGRIQYREEQRLEKLEEKKQLQNKLQMEEMERQKRLDKLRATVCHPFCDIKLDNSRVIGSGEG